MTRPRLLLLVLLGLACAVLGLGVVALSARERPGEPVAVTAVAPVTEGPLAVLRDWDRRRAAAWAAGDVATLRSLYVARSAAGARDADRLRRWLDRGMRVRRLETQVLRVRVAEERADLLRLLVTDRVARAVAAGRGHRVVLPDDRPTAWRITLRRVGATWRVASVSR